MSDLLPIRRWLTYLRYDLPWNIRHYPRKYGHIFWQRFKWRWRMNNPLIGLWVTLFSRTYRTEGCSFRLPAGLAPMGVRARFFFDTYEKEERVALRALLRPDDGVLELGASIGVIACATDKLLTRQTAPHVVVEGNPYVWPELFANKQRNTARFEIIPGILGQGKWRTFHIHEYFFGGSAHRKAHTEVVVPVFSLSDIEARVSGTFNVLIMDIEGGEHEVLTLLRDRLHEFRLVIVEFHAFIIGEELVEECKTILKSAGFQPVSSMNSVEGWSK